MNQPAVLLVCAVLATASSLATCQDSFSAKYLDFKLRSPKFDTNIEETKNALLALGVKSRDNPHDIVGKINDFLYRADLNPHHLIIYQELMQLSVSSFSYTKRSINRAMEICEILDDPNFQLREEFAEYMRHYSLAKLVSKLDLALPKLIPGSPKNNQAVRNLDELFATAVSRQTYDDSLMLQILESLDLSKSRLDVNSAILFISGYVERSEEEGKMDIGILLGFLNTKCREIQKGREKEINIITLAATFGLPSTNLPVEANKMKEYNRLCASLSREENKIRENLAKQITLENEFNVKYLDFTLSSKNWKVSIEQTKNALLDIRVNQGDLPDTILDRIKDLLRNSRLKRHRRHVYDELIHLSVSSYPCTESTTDLVMEICSILKNPTYPRQKEFVKFLSHFGILKFGKCTQSMEQEFGQIGSQDAHRALWYLDQLFQAVFGLRNNDLNGMVEMLTLFDLAESEFDISKAINVAINLGKWNKKDREYPLGILFEFIKNKCYELRNGRELPINVLTLAVTFGFPSEDLTIQAKKLTEYNRLCASLHRKPRKVRENLARQKSPSAEFNAKFVDFTLFSDNWQPDIRQTRDALISLQVNEGDVSAIVLSKIISDLNTKRLSEHKSDVYKDLVNLATPSSTCSKRMANRVLEICAILSEPTFQLKKEFSGFLCDYGSVKFGGNIQTVKNKLSKGSRENNVASQDLNQLFAATFGLDKNDREGLQKMLSRFDLSKSEFDVIKALEVALELKYWDEEERKKPHELLFAFIQMRCAKLREGREFAINVLTLASAFGFRYDDLPIQAIMLKEYNRLCASLRREEESVKDNIVRQINWDDWPNQAIVDLDKLFAASFGWQTYTEDMMVEKLRQLNLATSDLDVDKALEIAIYLERWGKIERKKPVIVIFTAIYKRCSGLESGREFLMNRDILAGIPDFPQEYLPIQVKKWREYNRLCTSLRRDEKSVMENIVRQVNWDDWPNQAILNLDELFAAFFGWQTYTEDMMVERLRQLNLATSDLDVKKAIEVALFQQPCSEEERKDPLFFLFTVIYGRCFGLESGREFFMNKDILDGNPDLPPEQFPTEVKKWREYNNLCARLMQDQQSFMNNLARQINRQDWPSQG